MRAMLLQENSREHIYIRVPQNPTSYRRKPDAVFRGSRRCFFFRLQARPLKRYQDCGPQLSVLPRTGAVTRRLREMGTLRGWFRHEQCAVLDHLGYCRGRLPLHHGCHRARDAAFSCGARLYASHVGTNSARSPADLSHMCLVMDTIERRIFDERGKAKGFPRLLLWGGLRIDTPND